MDEPYIWYWQLTETQYSSFCEMFGLDPEDTGFKPVDGYYYKVQDHNKDYSEYESMLMDWDDSDGEGGPNTFVSHYWTLSQVPAVMWP